MNNQLGGSMISQEYRNVVNPNNQKLFKAVNVRIGNLLIRAQTEGFIQGFSSEAKKGTGKKERHVEFEIRGAKYSERKSGDSRLKNADFSLYLSADKVGPVTINFYPIGHKARDLLSRIMLDRAELVKGPHVVTDTTSKEFHALLQILGGVLERAGAKLNATPRKKIVTPRLEI